MLSALGYAVVYFGIAWMLIGYMRAFRRIGRASRIQRAQFIIRYPRWVVVLSFAVSVILWPIMGELE